MSESHLKKGAYNVIVVCLGVRQNDRVVIIGDKEKWEIDEALFDEAKKAHK